MSKTIIKTRDLKKYFGTPAGKLHAVDGVNIEIEEGKTLGVVGESGCGKSTLGRTITRLLEATDGEVLYYGDNILGYSHAKMRDMRKNIQIIFQDPFSSLNPRMSVSEAIAEPIKYNKILKGRKEIEARVEELMKLVGLSPRLYNAYPHELDGGRRQRVCIARALALNPKFIVCDEPVSALDVSIQAQILNLLMDLQDKLGLSYMFITHDLSVVKHISDEIAVMYLGKVIEQAPADELFENPIHPYTKALLSAIPTTDIRNRKERVSIEGEITSPIEPAPGCRFASRCPYAKEGCIGKNLMLNEVSRNHFVACEVFGKR